ncbi:unnamed protein product [Rotaria magnacalcarata]|uniref:Tudor domain-containing protein 1 n=2 Tax=Rotaria magnacalcarata TaxID=392030 RepID=A0A814DS02_9BILA|nr:unnamed protein product [Rotaria magnacalcarata]CAF3985591.1 unnamed protein product [Rotaria magnacalcarata]
MNDNARRVNSIIIKNLPTNYDEGQLEELFSKFGRIVSSKVLPTNPNFDGGCGFVNFAEQESCTKAVETMNNFSIDRFTLRVNHSSARSGNTNTERPQNGFRSNGDLNENISRTSSPSFQNRFSGFRAAASEHSTTDKIQFKQNGTSSNRNESDTLVNNNKPLWNSTNIERENEKDQLCNEPIMNIREHDSFVINKNYCVYLSNLEVPNIIFAATLDDYVNATLLITQMNKHEQLTKIQSNSYKSKLVVGQCCAALFNGDWYRARILEIDENRVHVQYVDWGNTGWCDSILEIRPLPNEYYKDPVLCVKCILDEVPTENKPSDEQTNAILEILVLDLKLEMTVLRIENGAPYVQLDLGKRNLNAEIRAILPQPAAAAAAAEIISKASGNEPMSFEGNKPEMNPTEIHSVQLTTVDTEAECFHVLLMRDCLPTIMNLLKDWNINKQPLTKQPEANMLVCAQYDGDDLWYRAWILNVSDKGFCVYFVDFGNEEVVSMDRLSECPDVIRNIPWQSVQIKLANIKLTNEERYILLRDFETARLDMKILGKNQDIYSVDLVNNGKSLTECILELRQKKEQQAQVPPIINEAVKESVESIQQPVTKLTTPTPVVDENVSRTFKENIRPASIPAHPKAQESKGFVETNHSKSLPAPPPPIIATNSSIKLNPETKSFSSQEKSIDSTSNDNFTTMITEQRRQNRLLEQVIAAINTTNALLTQLVQR